MNRMVGLLLILCVLLLIVGIVWLNTTSKSVLWAFRERDAVSTVPFLVIFNPFRDKKAEVASEEALTAIRNGNCNDVLSGLHATDRHRSLCENLMADSLDKWRLVFREDHGNSVTLLYRTKRVSRKEFDGEISVTLTLQNDRMRLIDIGPVY